MMGLSYSETPLDQDVAFAAHARMLAALLDAPEIGRVDLCGNATGGGPESGANRRHSRPHALALALEHLEVLTPELVDLYFTPLVASEGASANWSIC